MIIVIIKPKAPDVNGVIYPMVYYTSPLLVIKEKENSVVVMMYDYTIEFSKHYIIKSI